MSVQTVDVLVKWPLISLDNVFATAATAAAHFSPYALHARVIW